MDWKEGEEGNMQGERDVWKKRGEGCEGEKIARLGSILFEWEGER